MVSIYCQHSRQDKTLAVNVSANHNIQVTFVSNLAFLVHIIYLLASYFSFSIPDRGDWYR